jgi:hypothetical protein
MKSPPRLSSQNGPGRVQPEGSGPTRIRKAQGSNPSSGSISSVKDYQARRADLDEINSGNLSVLTTGRSKSVASQALTCRDSKK